MLPKDDDHPLVGRLIEVLIPISYYDNITIPRGAQFRVVQFRVVRVTEGIESRWFVIDDDYWGRRSISEIVGRRDFYCARQVRLVPVLEELAMQAVE